MCLWNGSSGLPALVYFQHLQIIAPIMLNYNAHLNDMTLQIPQLALAGLIGVVVLGNIPDIGLDSNSLQPPPFSLPSFLSPPPPPDSFPVAQVALNLVHTDTTFELMTFLFLCDKGRSRDTDKYYHSTSPPHCFKDKVLLSSPGRSGIHCAS